MNLRPLGPGLLMTAVLIGTASAAEMCVVCSEPAATYRCTVEHGEKAQQFRGGDRVLQYLCITELAKAGHHARCAVSRDPPSSCLGEGRTVTATGVEGREQGEAARAAPRAAQAPDAAPKDDAPKTLVELARKTNDSVKDSAKSAGSAVGGAIQKTWNCLTSLFQGC